MFLRPPSARQASVQIWWAGWVQAESFRTTEEDDLIAEFLAALVLSGAGSYRLLARRYCAERKENAVSQ